MLGPALAAFALTRNPSTENARIKTRMASSPILKSLDDFALQADVGRWQLRRWATAIGIACSMARVDCYTAVHSTMAVIIDDAAPARGGGARKQHRRSDRADDDRCMFHGGNVVLPRANHK